MKPTQQEIIELAREHATRYTNRHYPDKPVFTFTQDALQKVIELALERFGAGGGGGETVLAAVFDENLGRPKLVEGCPELYHGQKLYPHPSPTDLQAAYARGLEDAAKVARAGYDTFWQRHELEFPKAKYDQASVLRTLHSTVEFVSTDIADAIEALKGKQ